jgi:hypothetical protein
MISIQIKGKTQNYKTIIFLFHKINTILLLNIFSN